MHLNQPAIITSFGGDPNSSSTKSYIPGAAIRGAVAKALGDPDKDSSIKEEFYDLVLGRKVRYLNAYPFVGDWRALPTPFSLRENKGELLNSNDAKDLSAYHEDSWPEGQLKPIGEEFITIGTAQPLLFHPKVSSRIHHQRDRKKGRAWKDKEGNAHGTIFTFESLDARQTFSGVVQLRGESEQDLQRIESRIKILLGGSLLVGRSRRAGYGGMASMKWIDSMNREIKGAGKAGLQILTSDVARHDYFRLLLTSPCIVRDPNTGQIDPAALDVVITDLLGDRAELMRKVWSFETIGGFNLKWRLELPQTLAVSAGSVLVCKASRTISLHEIYEIEHEGLGERREEGNGRILFLDAPQQSISLNKYVVSPPKAKENGQIPSLVSYIESRIVQAQIARKIEETAAELAQNSKYLPKNSLIGRLRTPLRSNVHDPIDTLRLWLKSVNEMQRLKRPAMEQLERCRIDNVRNLRDWLLDTMATDNVFACLNIDSVIQRFCVISEETAKRGVEEKNGEIAVRLIDAVLAAMALLNKIQEGEDGQ
jgi:CRISPR-associated protein Csx10